MDTIPKIIIDTSAFIPVLQYKYLCELAIPSVNVDICRDEKDNKFLSLAKHIQADFLITVDNDLLTLNPFENTVICKGRDFMEILEKSRTVKSSP